MPTPQPGIFATGTTAHYYLEFDLSPSAGPHTRRAAVAALAPWWATTAGMNLVVGFGAAAWEAAGGTPPATMTAFTPVTGPDGFTMPATQHDIWVWLAGSAPDQVLGAARQVAADLSCVAEVAAEQPAFATSQSRDLTGFIDGTENPPLDQAPGEATIPDGLPGAGGSVVLVQRWVHHLDQFWALPVAEQEKVFGRTRDDSTELDDQVKPPDAHIARVVIEEEGKELEIFRRSTSFGTLSASGLAFVAFSQDQDRLVRMLGRMAGRADGIRDRLTRFTTPTTGSFYFAPPLEDLAGPA